MSVRPSVPLVGASGHQALCGVEYNELFLSLSAVQKANLFRNASTYDTSTVMTVGHAATDDHSTYGQFVHHEDNKCRKLEHVSFVAVEMACAYLFQNHVTRIALTASANALADNMFRFFPSSMRTDVSCPAASFGVASSTVSHGTAGAFFFTIRLLSSRCSCQTGRDVTDKKYTSSRSAWPKTSVVPSRHHDNPSRCFVAIFKPCEVLISGWMARL